MTKIWFVGVLAVAAACGDDGGGAGNNPLNSQEAQPLCEEGCMHDATCDPNSGRTVAECTADCVGDLGGGWARQDAIEQLLDCTNMLACDANDDACFNAIPATDKAHEWEASCNANLVECGLDAAQCDVDGESDASIFKFMIDSVVQEFIDCNTRPDCTQRMDCFDAVADKYGLNF